MSLRYLEGLGKFTNLFEQRVPPIPKDCHSTSNLTCVASSTSEGDDHTYIYIYNYLLNKGHGSCVCNNWIDVKLLLFSFSFFSPFNKAGGPSMYCERWSNEAATVHADITADHRDVPAFFMSFFCNGTWLTREPPSQFCQLRCHLMLCAFSAICFSTIFSDVLTSFFEVCILVWSTYDIFGKPSSFSRSTTTRSTLGLIV